MQFSARLFLSYLYWFTLSCALKLNGDDHDSAFLLSNASALHLQHAILGQLLAYNLGKTMQRKKLVMEWGNTGTGHKKDLTGNEDGSGGRFTQHGVPEEHPQATGHIHRHGWSAVSSGCLSTGRCSHKVYRDHMGCLSKCKHVREAHVYGIKALQQTRHYSSCPEVYMKWIQQECLQLLLCIQVTGCIASVGLKTLWWNNQAGCCTIQHKPTHLSTTAREDMCIMTHNTARKRLNNLKT